MSLSPSDSTPLRTSTPQGETASIARFTLSGLSPPARSTSTFAASVRPHGSTPILFPRRLQHAARRRAGSGLAYANGSGITPLSITRKLFIASMPRLSQNSGGSSPHSWATSIPAISTAAATSSNRGLTHIPTLRTVAGALLSMSAAWRSDTRRRAAHSTTPSISARPPQPPAPRLRRSPQTAYLDSHDFRHVRPPPTAIRLLPGRQTSPVDSPTSTASTPKSRSARTSSGLRIPLSRSPRGFQREFVRRASR